MRLVFSIVMALTMAVSLRAAGPGDTKAAKPYTGRTDHNPELVMKPGKGAILLTVKYPKGYHYTSDAPTSFDWHSSDSTAVTLPRDPSKFNFSKIVFPIIVPVTAIKGKAEITIDASLFFCENKSGVCHFDNVRMIVPIKVDSAGLSKVSLTIDAAAPGGKEDL